MMQNSRKNKQKIELQQEDHDIDLGVEELTENFEIVVSPLLLV